MPIDEVAGIDDVLGKYRTVAVVGASNNPERASYVVAHFLKEHGYRVIPVNPNARSVMGETCYPDLISTPDPVQVVDIFRRPENVPAIVEQAIAKGAQVIWMQLGITSEKAAARAKEAGLTVVMDRCMKRELKRYLGLAQRT
jgi:predicted CoA-binding protein